MAKFLKTSDINSHIEAIIQMARNKVVLISPYLQLSESWLAALESAAARGVTIILICRKKKVQPDIIEIAATIPGLRLHNMKGLHAKCYFNEQQMVIASMNLYAYSAKNNKEMGVMLDRMGDAEAFEDAIQETRRFIQSAQQELLLPSTTGGIIKTLEGHGVGKCIRCSDQIKYNASQPLCTDCFIETKVTAAPHYLAKYCHACGTSAPTSMWYPLCTACTRNGSSSIVQIAL